VRENDTFILLLEKNLEVYSYSQLKLESIKIESIVQRKDSEEKKGERESVVYFRVKSSVTNKNKKNRTE